MQSKNPLEGLNPEQLKAVKTVNGRVLILAGAGSGKTRVLTMRMAYLIKELHAHPKSILGLTFTNKAAAEMRHRIGSLVDPKEAKQVTLCTFHSFCMHILRAEIDKLGYTAEFSLYDEKDIHRLVTQIARDLLQMEGEMPSLAATIAAIGKARNKGLQAAEIAGTGSQWHDEFTQSVFSRLQDSMRAYNAVDFDSLLWLTVELFQNHPDVLNKYQERFRYIMIDEYQDTNPVQFKLASQLSAKYGNLCVVGDDDQSIYGWRGADVHNILSFEKATVIRLEQNYRSTNSILKAANAVIQNNKKRHAKELWSNRGEGDLIEVFHAPTEHDEAQAVVCRIAKLKQAHGLRWSDMAILYRSYALSRAFELALMKHSWYDRDCWVRGIPYEICGGQEFFERREIRDLFGYLRVIVNPRDEEALLRVLNQPRRGIGESSLDMLTAYNRKNAVPLWEVLLQVGLPGKVRQEIGDQIANKACQGIQEFVAIIKGAQHKFASEPLHESLAWLVEKIDYRKAIHEEVKSEQMRAFKWDNVQEFVSSLADFEEHYKNGLEKQPTLRDFITELPLETDWDSSRKARQYQEDKLKLLTFHSSKGLEFPACFLVGMEDHIMPHEKSLLETGIEEERRLMYVAITRAMKFLTISMARQRKRMGKDHSSKPSRFLSEIPKGMIRLTHWHEV